MKTQKACKEGVAMRGLASQLTVGMHFRLLPHGFQPRSRWYRVSSINADTREITAIALTGKMQSIRISATVNVLRLLSEDQHLGTAH